MLIDKTEFLAVAGHGGAGSVAWLRRKFLPKGGPGGGDGGRGGDVIVTACRDLRDLGALAAKFEWKAANGASGGTNCKTGAAGANLYLSVPEGTAIYDVEDEETVLYDLDVHGKQFVICQGGDGGLGNYHFRSSTNQAPSMATSGYPGDVKKFKAVLKMIADIGLVGLPNAGKSSIVRVVSNSKARVDNYPFTTLEPNLGMVLNSRVCVADIPGIVKGASIGKGLGFEFLQHIERTTQLYMVLDVSCCDLDNPLKDFYVLRQELVRFGGGIANKKYKIIFNKCDLLSEKEKRSLIELMHCEEEVFFISTVTNEGVDALLYDMKQVALFINA